MEAELEAFNAQNMESTGILLNYVTAHEAELKVQRTCSAVRKLERLIRDEISKLPNDSPLHKILRDSGWKQWRFQFSTECPIDLVPLKHKLASLYLDRVSLQHRQDSGSINDVETAIKSFCPDTLVRCAKDGILASKAVQKNHGLIDLAVAIAAAVKSVSVNLMNKGNGDVGARTEPAAPSHSSVSFFGTCMLVDISGFTKLSASLCDKGSAGLDDLHLAISGYLGRCVDIVYAHGGDVISFAGDALICVFYEPSGWRPANQNDEMNTPDMSPDATQDRILFSTPNALAAVRCAMELKEHYTDTLTAHVALSCGKMSFAMLGGLKEEYICLVLGKCINEIATCINDAESKQLVVTPTVLYWVQQELSHADNGSDNNVFHICDLKTTHILPSGNYRVDSVGGVYIPAKSPRRFQEIPSSEEMMCKLRKFVPSNVLDSLSATNHISSELREVTTIFLKLDSYDVTAPMEENIPLLQLFFLMVQQVLADTGGFMRQFLLDDKGCVLIAMWGVPYFTYPNNCSRAIRAATAIIHHAKEMQQLCSVGITTGQVYCGVVGSVLRREYVGIGSAVNMSARLMSKARGRILIDEETRQRLPLNTRDMLREIESLHLKGIAGEVVAFHCPCSIDNVAVSTIVDDARDQTVYIQGELMEALSFQLNALSERCKAEDGSGILLPVAAATQSFANTNILSSGQAARPLFSSSGGDSSIVELGSHAPVSMTTRFLPSLSAGAPSGSGNSFPPKEEKMQLGAADTSPSTFTVILGPAGSGKSTYGEYFRRGAIARGLNCVFVRAHKGDEHIAYKTLGKLLIELIGPYDLSSERRQKVALVRLVKQVVPDRNALDVLGESRTIRAALGYKWLASLEVNAARKFEADHTFQSSRNTNSAHRNLNHGNALRSFSRSLNTGDVFSPDIAGYNAYDGNEPNENSLNSAVKTGAGPTDAGAVYSDVIGSYQARNDCYGSEVSDQSVNLFTLREKGSLKHQHDGLSDHLITKLLLLLLKQRGTAIVIDDAHNADELSWAELHRIQEFPLQAAFLLLLSRPYSRKEDGSTYSNVTGTNHSKRGNDSFASSPPNTPLSQHSENGNVKRGSFFPPTTAEGSNKLHSSSQSSASRKTRLACGAVLKAIQNHSNCVTLDIPPLGLAEVQQLLEVALDTPNLRRVSIRAQTLGAGKLSSSNFALQNSSLSYQISRELVDAVLQVSDGNAFWCRIIADFIVERGVKDFMRCVHSVSESAEEGEASGPRIRGVASAESSLRARIASGSIPAPSPTTVNGTNSIGRSGISKSSSFRKPNQERNPLNVLAVYCLETLDPNLQVFIKHAAIIGHEFSQDELCAALPDIDTDLVREGAELLLESGFILSTNDADVDTPESYCFQNCLMRDAIYNLMPPRKAAKIHELVAQHIRTSNAENIIPHLGRLCYHYSQVTDRQYEAFAFAVMAARHCIMQQALHDCLFFVNCAMESLSIMSSVNSEMKQTVLAIVDIAIELLQPVHLTASIAGKVRAFYSRNLGGNKKYLPLQVGFSSVIGGEATAHLLDAFNEKKMKLVNFKCPITITPEGVSQQNCDMLQSPKAHLPRRKISAIFGLADCSGCSTSAVSAISPSDDN